MNPWSLFSRWLYANLGEQSKAIESYQQALALVPDMEEAHYMLGMAFKRTGEREKALAEFTECVRLHPDVADPYMQQAAAYSLLGRRQKRLKH
jgi:tetratricopeptide (TPR) repeat protein